MKRATKKRSTMQQYDLFRRRTDSVGVVFPGSNPRNVGFASSGYQAFLDEISEDPDGVDPLRAMDAPRVYLPLLSVQDAERAIIAFRHGRPRGMVIAGGQGCISIAPLLDIVDVAHFGRIEGVAASVRDGECSAHTWTKHSDPSLLGHYSVRQPQQLLRGETGFGCARRCAFCQYGNIYDRLSRDADSDYSDPVGLRHKEDHWTKMDISSGGVATTALDGLSESTRRRVGKGLSDDVVFDDIDRWMRARFSTAVYLNVFQIVGYPWETFGSATDDIARFVDRCRRVDARAPSDAGRVVLVMRATQFSPEPLTPMEDEPVSLLPWRQWVIDTGKVYTGEHIEVWFQPSTPGLYTTLKRVAINRGVSSGAFLRGHDAAKRESGDANKAAAFLGEVGDLNSCGFGLWPKTYLTTSAKNKSTKEDHGRPLH